MASSIAALVAVSRQPPRFVTANSRQLALHTLLEWEHGQSFAQDILERLATKYHLEHRDTALLQTLVFSVLRNITLLDHWLDQVCENKHLEKNVHWLLRLGAAQLLLLDIPPHAAVNECVNLAGKARGLTNAVLRRIEREKELLLAQRPSLSLEDQFSHPDWLIQRWTEQRGIEATAKLCEWDQNPAQTYIRINRLHPQALDDAALAELTPADRAGFYRVEQPPREWLASGQCYVQDPSTAMACELLAPQPGEFVLDACAAPGGKAAYLAQLMKNQGRIIAADSSSRRVERMKSNLQRLHASIAEPKLLDWADANHPTDPVFDRILVDAPCSNTGVMRRRIDVRWRLLPWSFKEMTQLQNGILEATLPLLKPGGSLVYSTCSIDREENEGVVETVLKKLPGFKLIETRESLPWRDGFDGAFAALIRRD